uniref:Tropomodulin n=1 Tax=Romanomermis culicivorax TaxID=13658 RepID=A0A915JNG9_ROMCU
MATKGRLYNGLSAAKDAAPRPGSLTTGPAKKEDASWIGAKNSAQDKPKPWNQRGNNPTSTNAAQEKPSWAASRKLLEPSPGGVSHARSETDLTGINKPKTTPVKDQEIFNSSEQLNVDDDDVSVSVTLSLPKTPVSQPISKKTSEKVDDDYGAEHAVRPSAVKATQPKLQDVVGAGSALAQKTPKNINKEALLDQFNAMWDKADEIPEIEIIKCGLPETKSIPEPENDTDAEYCIQRLLANDPELTEINLNNMKRTPLPQLHRLLEALHENNYLKKLSLANLGLSDTGLEPLLNALEANESLKVLNLETNYLSGDFIARIFQSLLKNQTLEEVKAVNQSVIMGSKAEVAIMKAIHQNRGLWKVSLSLRLPEAKQKIDQALIRNGELRRLKRQIEAMGAQSR